MSQQAAATDAPPRRSDLAPVRLGFAGVAGYGGELIDQLRSLEHRLAVPSAVAAVYEAFPERAGELIYTLEAEGVHRHDTFDALLADPDVEMVWLPVPIHLHRDMTLAAFAAGKAVMCEKPATASVAELKDMIAARDAAGLPLLIGFQEVYDPATRDLKQRLIDGVIGRVERVSVRASWPRADSYFARSDWAGRRTIDGAAVHDSPLANALAHFVNLALLFAGVDRLDHAATATDLDATLYRVNPIENFDTVTLRSPTDAGPELLVWLTHAGHELVHPVIQIDGDAGRVTRTLGEVRIEPTNSEPEVITLRPRDRAPMFDALGAVVRGLPNDRSIIATPELAMPHTRLVEQLAGLAIETIPEHAVETAEHPNGTLKFIPGIEQRFADAQTTGQAPLNLLP
ncbi:MAG: Gfo/Idh/MocA family oxidoreductase [Planctomycetota bacterium]